MKQLPEARVYELGLEYWPYKTLLKTVADHVVEHAPSNATLLDIMCGPGYLLGKIKARRPDLSLLGVDIDERYIPYGRTTYPGISFELGDVLTWRPNVPFDVVVCTGALHHVSYGQQEAAVANIASMVKPDGIALLSDVYISDYADETERKLAAAKLGYEYLRATIKNGAPDQVVEWTADILWNDVLKHEYKTSLKKRSPVLGKYFGTVALCKTWPEEEPEQETAYGEYMHLCIPQ